MLILNSSLSDHNKSIKAQISSDKYTEEQVKCKWYSLLSVHVTIQHVGAIQRKYESIHWQWVMDNKVISADKIEAQVKHNKYRARRIRVSFF